MPSSLWHDGTVLHVCVRCHVIGGETPLVAGIACQLLQLPGWLVGQSPSAVRVIGSAGGRDMRVITLAPSDAIIVSFCATLER